MFLSWAIKSDISKLVAKNKSKMYRDAIRRDALWRKIGKTLNIGLTTSFPRIFRRIMGAGGTD